MFRSLKTLPRLAAWYAGHDPAQPVLLLVLLLAWCWPAAPLEPTPPAASFALLADLPSPNLNCRERETSDLPSERPTTPPTVEVVEAPVSLPEPEILPVSLRLPEPEPATREPATTLLVPTCRGETTMMRTWKLAGWPALLVMAAAPVVAAEPAEPDKNTAIILKKLDDLQKSLEGQLKMVREDQLSDRLQLQKATADLATLKEQVGQLRKDLEALRSQSTTRVALSPATTTGRIRLVNIFPDEMTVLVNQTAYRLQPGEVRTLESHPAGGFLYQVLGAQTAPQNRLLAANETFTITVYPR